jgi:hypothetical protein
MLETLATEVGEMARGSRDAMMVEIWELEGREPTERELLFKNAHASMTERVARFDERLLTVIKTHLSCEGALNQLLAAAGRSWKNKKFAGKLYIAQEHIKPAELEKPLWAVADAGNKLRNAVVHGHNESVIAAKMSDLRAFSIAASTPEQKPYIQGMTDPQMVMSAFNHCGSHMIVAADRIKQELKQKG